MRRPRTRTLVLLTGLGDMLFVPVPFKHQLADSIPGDFVSRLRSTLPRGLYDRPCWSNLGRSATLTICARCGKTLYMSVSWICGTVSAQASLTTTRR